MPIDLQNTNFLTNQQGPFLALLWTSSRPQIEDSASLAYVALFTLISQVATGFALSAPSCIQAPVPVPSCPPLLRVCLVLDAQFFYPPGGAENGIFF